MKNPSILLQTLSDNNRQRVIAYDENAIYTLENFQYHVSQFKTIINQHGSQKWILAIEDVLSFAAGFFALASLNKTILLPPSLKQGAIEDVFTGTEKILTDKIYDPKKFSAIELASLRDHTPAPQTNLENSYSTSLLEMFTSGSSGEPKKITKSIENLESELLILEKNMGATH